MNFYKSKFYVFITGLFVLIELILLYLILFGDCDKSKVCFSAVAVSFLFMLSLIKIEKKAYLLVIAYVFILISDAILELRYVVTNALIDQEIAVTTFLIAQILISLYMLTKIKNHTVRLVQLSIRIFLMSAGIIATVIVLKDGVNYLALVSVFYIINLFVSLVFSFINVNKFRLFALSLLFFICCDILLGLSFLFEMYLKIEPNSFLHVMVYGKFNYIWLFYCFMLITMPLSVYINSLIDNRIKREK